MSNENNVYPIPDNSIPESHLPPSIYRRDDKYYYPDGNTVLLFDGCLYKLHFWIIFGLSAPVLRGDNGEINEALLHQINASSDSNPVTLPNITGRQFRNFLVALLGRPYEREHQDLQIPCGYFICRAHWELTLYTHERLITYLDIAFVAQQLGIFRLGTWACDWLEMAMILYNEPRLREPEMIRGEWRKETILQFRSFSSPYSERLASAITAFIWYHIYISVDEKADQHEFTTSNLSTCVALYQDPTLPDNDPELFGCVFASILSLGHGSSTWTKLTTKERTLLSVAQTQLVTMSNQLDCLNWLITPWESLPCFKDICLFCQPKCSILWHETFGQCQGMSSSVPLQDISALARLPYYRRLLRDKWCGGKASVRGRLASALSNLRGDPLSRFPSDCWGCAYAPLERQVDERIAEAYKELTGVHKRLTLELRGECDY